MEENGTLSPEEMLYLVSLREVFGGFAHEMAQPLNAIMIAAQVVQLKLDRTLLTDEEKGFLKHRLNIVTSQVQRAAEIVESLRIFSRGAGARGQETGIKGIFEKILGLMGQQFVNRGIDLTWVCDESSPTKCENLSLLDGIIIQSLAFARDSVSAIASLHEREGKSYTKRVRVRLTSGDCSSSIRIEWDAGELRLSHEITDIAKHIGLHSARSVISDLGGRLEKSDSGLAINFS
jgi:signal transduction histidine kinase